MNYNALFVFGITTLIVVFVFAFILEKVRRAFLVPEGYVGLLYHEGKYLETLAAGRHIRWGRHYTLDAQDLRKTAWLVAGQEVLTADTVSLKSVEGEAGRTSRARTRSWRKRSPAQSRECGSRTRGQSSPHEPAPDAVALGCSERRQHARGRRAKLCSVKKRQGRFA